MYILDHDPAPVAQAADEKFTLRLELAPGKPEDVTIELSQEAVSAAIDVLYRVGGRELIDHYKARIGVAAFQSFRRPAPRLGGTWERVLDLTANAVTEQNHAIVDALLVLAAVAERVFREELDGARAALRLSRYGLAEVDFEAPPVTEAGRDEYRRLRSAIVALDAKRRRVARWDFTIPDNAPHAREQFKADLEPYISAYREVTREWPALAACGAELMALLGKKPESDVQRWAKAPDQDGTRLDDYIKEAIAATWTGYVSNKDKFLNAQLAAARRGSARLRHQSAFRRGDITEGRYLGELAGLKYLPADIDTKRDRDLDPEAVIGEHHPLFRHPFLIYAALEQLEWQPGDLGYAAGLSATRAAKKAVAAEEASSRWMGAILGWASLGFGVIAFIPVIGQIAVVAAIATSAGLALRNSLQFVDETNRRQAVGPLADRFEFEEPEAAGFIVDVLGLVTDIALPALGRAINAVLKPAGRLLAAARVERLLSRAGHGLDIASMAIEANATLLAADMRRLGLDRAEVSD